MRIEPRTVVTQMKDIAAASADSPERAHASTQQMKNFVDIVHIEPRRDIINLAQNSRKKRSIVNEREQQELIRYLGRRLKECHRELVVYRVFAQLLKEAGYGDVEQVLEAARNSPAVQDWVDKYYAGFDELIGPSDGGIQEGALREFLERWKPDGGTPGN